VKFYNEITIDSPPARTFALVTDMQRVADSLPGATLLSSEADQHRGVLAMKIGPISASYEGTITFLERDEASRRAVWLAQASDSRGAGSANATIALGVEDLDGRSRIVVETDAQVRGRVAQLGKGAMDKVAGKLFEAFAENLQVHVVTASGGGHPATGGHTAESDAPVVVGTPPTTRSETLAPRPQAASVLDAGDLLGIRAPSKEARAFAAGIFVGLAIRSIVRDFRDRTNG
jgi:carbon monoxide dehydrogenase subunit G